MPPLPLPFRLGLGSRRRGFATRLIVGLHRRAIEDRPVGLSDMIADGIEAEGGVGHLDHAVAPVDLKRDLGCHPGEELELGVGRGEDDRIGDDVLRGRRGEADLGDLSLEHLPWIRIDGKLHRLPRFLRKADLADVGFIDGGEDPHLAAHVGGDDKQLRRLKLRGECLAELHLAIDDDPGDRREDLRVIEVGQ